MLRRGSSRIAGQFERPYDGEPDQHESGEAEQAEDVRPCGLGHREQPEPSAG
jgi:hypothetical protein